MMRLLIALLIVAVSSASGGFYAAELWVVGHGTHDIRIIDTDTQTVIGSPVPLDSVPDAPGGIAFSTTPTQQGTYAFVTQGRYLSVYEVLPRVHFLTFDIGALIGASPLELVDCASAGPSSFLPLPRTLLHCAARVGSQAWYIILDQEALIANDAGSMVVAGGPLRDEGRGIGVTVLEAPNGNDFQRAYYTVRDTDPMEQRAFVYKLTLPRETEPVLPVGVTEVREIQTGPVPPPEVDRLHIGSPSGREMAVVPRATEGILENLNTGGTCLSPGREFTSVSVSGVGPGSYSVFALDRSGEELVFVDPANCAELPVPLGSDPTGITVIGRQRLESLAVTNHGDDTVTIVTPDGIALVAVPLGPPPSGGICDVCPVDADVAHLRRCAPIHSFPSYLPTFPDRVFLSWSDECSPGGSYTVWCQCLSDLPSCPVSCACPGQGCVDDLPFGRSPALSSTALGTLGQLLDPIASKVPWKELGEVEDGDSYIHDGEGIGSANLVYLVTTRD